MTRVTLAFGGLGRRLQRKDGSACRAAHVLSCPLSPASSGPAACSAGRATCLAAVLRLLGALPAWARSGCLSARARSGAPDSPPEWGLYVLQTQEEPCSICKFMSLSRWLRSRYVRGALRGTSLVQRCGCNLQGALYIFSPFGMAMMALRGGG